MEHIKKTTSPQIMNFKRFNYNSQHSSDKHGPDPHDNIDQLFDLKPDFNYYNVHDIHKLNSKMVNCKNKFSLLHTNIQSLNHNFENLELLITSLEHDFDVIALSEIWCSKEKLTFNPGNLNGYQPFKFTTGTTLKGGCGM